jgi:hypothetical protein
MSKQDFEIGGHSTLENFATDLTEFWENNDNSNFCKLIPSLNEIANELYFIQDESEELSPYIYVMF